MIDHVDYKMADILIESIDLFDKQHIHHFISCKFFNIKNKTIQICIKWAITYLLWLVASAVLLIQLFLKCVVCVCSVCACMCVVCVCVVQCVCVCSVVCVCVCVCVQCVLCVCSVVQCMCVLYIMQCYTLYDHFQLLCRSRHYQCCQ